MVAEAHSIQGPDQSGYLVLRHLDRRRAAPQLNCTNRAAIKPGDLLKQSHDGATGGPVGESIQLYKSRFAIHRRTFACFAAAR